MKTGVPIFLLSWLALFAACDDKDLKLDQNISVVPDHFRFVVLDANGQPLLTSPDDQQVTLYYFKDNQRVDVGRECAQGGCQMINAFEPPSLYPYYYRTLEVPSQSGTAGIRTFYLQTGEDVDTITLTIQKLPRPDPKTGESFTRPAVTFNGEAYREDETLTPWAYVFQK